MRHSGRQRGAILTAGEVACYASHVSVWRDAAARAAAGPLLVLEDDADLDANFVASLRGALARLPPDWDVLWVGSCYEENQQADSPQKVAHRCGAVLCCDAATLAARLRTHSHPTPPCERLSAVTPVPAYAPPPLADWVRTLLR